ncbi:T9SS type A sorting domain-containing protein [Flammeovirga aprica]|uniref:T9SS type A sorting domain-containing protein n=1 Tax=Flammeovirga aprica JL-4 TaxID=694437 RepID=A0A7X9RYG0_9BACT|nr:T9SS type A sorting domain-containing protein [Flammeovirga aprica]NME71031.1 T9SS type A sorting domain-containing protein [Flammeovirga aprica JL-4]
MVAEALGTGNASRKAGTKFTHTPSPYIHVVTQGQSASLKMMNKNVDGMSKQWVIRGENYEQTFNTAEVSLADLPYGQFSAHFTLNGEKTTSKTFTVTHDLDYNVPDYGPLENELSTSNTITLYPNPANKIVNVNQTDLDNKFSKVELIDLQGRIVKQYLQGLEGNFSLNIDTIKSGYYMVVLYKNNGQPVMKKLIIQ